MNLLVIIGTTLLTVASIPQLFKVIREGNANGMAIEMLLCWISGLGSMFLYVLLNFPQEITLLVNYGLNFIISSIFIYYRLFPRIP